jgi:hypothetical protein
VELVETVARVELIRAYCVSAPNRVRGRKSDDTLIVEYLGSAPEISFGLERTYWWIYDQITGGPRPAL